MITKKYFVDAIEAGEERALEAVNTVFKMEVNRIKKEALDEKHLKDLISQYMAKTMNRYSQQNNYYKNSYEAFTDLVELTTLKDNKKDRIDFIATMLISFYESKDYTEQDSERLNFLDQLKNLENIVFETTLSRLKNKAFKTWLSSIETHSDLTAKEIAYQEFYMRESKDYSGTNKTFKQIHEDFAKMNGGKNTKNIETAYNEIQHDKSERLRNHKKILKVINHMTRHLPQYKKSIQLAEEEYNKAIEKYS